MGNAFSGAYQKATLPVKLMTTFLTHFKFNTLSLDMIPFVFHLLKQDGFSSAFDFKITKDHIKKLLKSKNISLQVIIRIDNFFKKYDVKDGSIAFEKDIHKLLDIVISFFKNDKTTTDEETSRIGASPTLRVPSPVGTSSLCENIVIKEDVEKIEKLVLIKKIFTDLKPDEIHNIVQNIIYILHQMLSNPEEYGLECPDSKPKPNVEQDTSLIKSPLKTQPNKGGRKRKHSKKCAVVKKRRTRRRLQ